MKNRKQFVVGLFIAISCMVMAMPAFAEKGINIDGEYEFEEVLFTGEEVEGLSAQGAGTGFVVNEEELEFLENGESINSTKLSLKETKVVCPGTEEKECDHYSAELGDLILDFYFTEEKMYYDLSYYLQGIADEKAYCVYTRQNDNSTESADLFGVFKQGSVESAAEAITEEGMAEDVVSEETASSETEASLNNEVNETAGNYSVEEIKNALIGNWHVGDVGEFDFEEDFVNVRQNGVSGLTGTYTIETEDSNIIMIFDTADNIPLQVTMPYTTDGGVLTVYNNEGAALVKDGSAEIGNMDEVGDDASLLSDVDINSTSVVRLVQETLNMNGFDCGTADGISGKKTSEAIKQYQTAHQLPVTGSIDAELINSLGITEDVIKTNETAEDVNQENASWTASITAEVQNYAMQREDIAIAAKLESGPPSGSTKINYEIILPTGEVLDYCDEVEYALGDEAQVIMTHDILSSGYDLMETAFIINVYDSNGNQIGTFDDIASHWWDDSL